MRHTHTHKCTKENSGIPNHEMNRKHCDKIVFRFLSLQQFHNKSLFYMMGTQRVYYQFTLVYLEARMALSVYRLVWYRRLLTDVCWFEAMVNVPVKSAALLDYKSPCLSDGQMRSSRGMCLLWQAP